ncbi:hypothetical protein KFE98_18195 [bacterium SCSIO 12741]|nr:hypothetical protein KFE98_18195 [bacterium SCSIO 12741]
MKRFLLLLLSLFLMHTSGVWAQNSRKASDQIYELKNGVLLVRLMTRSKSINALEKAGNTKQADKIKAEQQQKNQQIIAAFQNYFDFCPVYFFLSDQTAEVKARNWDKVVFLNAELQADTSLTDFNPEVFMMAEFGIVEPKVNDGIPVSDQGLPGLVISNSDFVQLSAPFPYYIRTYENLPVEKKAQNAVEKWNQELHDFYTSTQK